MVIRIDLGQVNNASGQFNAKRAEMEAQINQARATMQNLEGQFTGNRARRIYSEWQGMQGNLNAAIQSLQAAGDLLRRAATEFGDTDAHL